MERGGNVACSHMTRKKAKLEKIESDESDEDYTVGKDEFHDSEDGYCSSLAEDESEECSEELEECEDKKIKMVGRHRGGKNLQGINNNEVNKPRMKKAACSEKDDCNNVYLDGAKQRKRCRLSRVSSTKKYVNRSNLKSRKKKRVSYKREQGDDDYVDPDYDNDEEFAPYEVDGVDDAEGLTVTKKKVGRPRVRTAQIVQGQKKKTNVKAVKRGARKKRKRRNVLDRRNRSGVGKKRRNPNAGLEKRKKLIGKYRGRSTKVNSGSDFLSTGSSDHHDYTTSEEEREQVREATEFCRRLTSSLRSSSFLNLTKDVEIPSQRKQPGKKGKEEVVDLKIDVGKQVCGICLSDEGKRAVSGILNCCSHYFCFSCIMEWSRVESRCPLCKQRFATISRTARVDSDIDLRSIISVPERDQVYQPSEEELRSYFDPYEYVLCTECQQGGDDALMLLCDLCDSPAHTYCVGLGHEVPEGNWYCDGCKPTALASSNAQALSPTLDAGGNYNLDVVSSSGTIIGETFDLYELYVPEHPATQVTVHSSPLRNYTSDSHAAFPASEPGAFTLSERRRIQRQIHQLLNNRNRHSNGGDGIAQVSGSNHLGSQVSRDGVTPQHTLIPERVAPQNINPQGRLPGYLNTSAYRSEVYFPRFSLMGQVLDSQASASLDYSIGGLPHNEFAGINARMFQGFSHQQPHPCSSRLSCDTDTGIPSQCKEVRHSPIEKERVQTMVKGHLKSLSRNLELGYNSFKDIARTSTHTILAAVGIDHRWTKVYPARTRPLSCDHFESRQTYPVKGQCSSCFDWFVQNVVREVMYNRVPLLSAG